ncbi:hypothetical protein FMUND_5477 [Fusarium mundagurra]|uniref:Uncharacterized protein n=1 Tax=Fusarium mundagurra TaxID=1567541 RepID=A0A8H5YSC8_9HYPO|nr:hypothetical protein FMUND_5477 [Fusarium mundagurra]
MPPPPRPNRGRPAFPKQDEDLWKAYAKSLQTRFFGNLDSKNEVFYAAPVGLLGIPVGDNISHEITNKGVYEISDALLQLDAPVFASGGKKYSRRLQDVLGAVKLRPYQDMGTEKRMNDIQARVRKFNADYAEVSEMAIESYAADENKGNMSFGQWAPRDYPTFVIVSREKESGVATEASMRAQFAGPGAERLNMQRQRLFSASEPDKTNPGLNMPCATSFSNIVNGSSDLPWGNVRYWRPTYTIESSYKDTVGNWIRDAGGENKLNLTFNINDAKSENWDKFGFVNVNANSRFTSFFMATYFQDRQKKEEVITAQDVGPEFSVQLSAAEAGVFTVKPAARVDQVILAYNVVLKISLPTNMADRVNELTQKAKSSGGSVSFFGFEFGFGGGRKDEVSISRQEASKSSKSSNWSLVGYPQALGGLSNWNTMRLEKVPRDHMEEQDPLQQLENTAFACSSLIHLGGGSANYVYRGILMHAMPTRDDVLDMESVIVNYSLGHVPGNAKFKVDLSRSVTYSAFIDVLKNFPDILERNFGVLERVKERAELELHDLTNGKDGSYRAPLKPETATDIIFIDWEMCQFGHRAYDLGRMRRIKRLRYRFGDDQRVHSRLFTLVCSFWAGTIVVPHRRERKRRTDLNGAKIATHFIVGGWEREKQ